MISETASAPFRALGIGSSADCFIDDIRADGNVTVV